MKTFKFEKNEKNPVTAAILSFFFIGLGQAYNGQIIKAAVLVILYAISIFLTVFIIGFVTTPILWIWSVVDAYTSSQRMNQADAPKQSTSIDSLFGLFMNFRKG